MSFYPSYELICQLAESHNMIPVSCEFPADMDTPISIFKQLKQDSFCFLLESSEGTPEMARYSFIGRNPFLVFQSKDAQVKIIYRDGREETFTGDPLERLQALCERYRSPVLPNIPQFAGGAVGHFGYDVIRLTEFLPNTPPDTLDLPDLNFMFMDELVVFDHAKQKVIVIVNMQTEGDLEAQYHEARRRLKKLKDELSQDTLIQKPKKDRPIPVLQPKSNMTREQFCEMVERAKEYIVNGDIFQVVLSQRFETETTADPFCVYRSIRLINPSPYLFYLNFGSYQLAGASPEMLVRVENGIVQTSPIAGTKLRGKTPDEDSRLEQELLSDPKENAEHTMLVDLGRNDIGKVSAFGTVRVSRFKYIQKFSHVMHMTSDVKGKLRKGQSVFDALKAVLPAGTLSGAPKVRAMQIIDELETVKRGCYGGAIGYIGFSGSLDSCITIRTAIFKDNKAYIQAGGGIVYDSVPQKEYQETVNKAAAMVQAIQRAGDFV